MATAAITAIFLSAVMLNLLLYCLHSLAPPGLDGPMMAGEKGLIGVAMGEFYIDIFIEYICELGFGGIF
ncbi:hypothetical protein DK254_08255 [Pseudomonas sp. RW407]|nr:hypothetical protein DK254_08255 [Pseudomonas sp. RW407]